MVASATSAPSSLAGPSAPGRSASRIAVDHRGATGVAPENAVSEQLAHRSDRTVAAPCLGRARPHRRDAHRGRCRFSSQTRAGRYSWARYYHPGLQRFISEDPIGFDGGDPNLYAYVGNMPTVHSDPLGLFADILVDAGFIATISVASFLAVERSSQRILPRLASMSLAR
jgi:RHS repeat-associated protein